MADNDSFVQEVTEEVRRDAMYAAWRKYGPFVVGAIAAVVLGTAGLSWYQNSQLETMREAGGAFIEAQSVEEPEAAATAFAELAQESEGDYAALARLRAASSFGAAGDVERAVETYQAVAEMDGIDPRLTDLAKLRAVGIRSDIMDPAEMLSALAPLSVPGAPWRSVALEFSAAAHVRAGDEAAAIDALSSIASDANASPAVQARAREMIAALGGTAPEPVTTRANDAPTAEDDTSEEGEDQ